MKYEIDKKNAKLIQLSEPFTERSLNPSLVSGLLKSSNLEVAIKSPKICLLTPDALTDFYEEARTAMGFRHENILQCLGISSEPNLLPCLLFEFMDFGDLASILANTRTKSIQRANLPHLSNVRNFCR